MVHLGDADAVLGAFYGEAEFLGVDVAAGDFEELPGLGGCRLGAFDVDLFRQLCGVGEDDDLLFIDLEEAAAGRDIGF